MWYSPKIEESVERGDEIVMGVGGSENVVQHSYNVSYMVNCARKREYGGRKIGHPVKGQGD